MAEESSKKISVDKDLCIGCGNCAATATEYFELTDGLAESIKDCPEADTDLIQETIDNCPGGAISLE